MSDYIVYVICYVLQPLSQNYLRQFYLIEIKIDSSFDINFESHFGETSESMKETFFLK